nr:probable methyltransferase PMT21 [Ipomoea batatas]
MDKWEPPPANLLKLNIDVAMDSVARHRRIGFGWSVHDGVDTVAVANPEICCKLRRGFKRSWDSYGSLAPRDNHKDQVQFDLERGILAILGIISTHHLPFPIKFF